MDSEQILVSIAVGGFMRLKVSQSSCPPELKAIRNIVRVIGCETFCFYAKVAALLLNAEIRRILGSRCLTEHRVVELELRPVRRKSD